jgi:hypothetical protein
MGGEQLTQAIVFPCATCEMCEADKIRICQQECRDALNADMLFPLYEDVN